VEDYEVVMIEIRKEKRKGYDMKKPAIKLVFSFLE